MVAGDWLRPDWASAHTALLHALAILGTGAGSALLAILLPTYGRLFLRPARRDSEVRHYAQSLFLRRELFNASQRKSVLVLVSKFERKVEIVADVGLHGVVSEHEWRSVISVMTPELAIGRAATALLKGLDRIDDLFLAKGLRAERAQLNELPDRPIEERGAR